MTTKTRSPAELNRILGNRREMEKLIGDPDGFRDFLAECRDVLGGDDDGPVRRLPFDTMTHRPSVWNKRQVASTPNAPGVALDSEFHSLGHFVASISPRSVALNGIPPSLRDITNDLGSTIGADGGFLIPEILRSDLLSTSLERSIVRPRATVIPMASLTVPIPAIDSTSHATSVFGGLIGYWTAESAALTESQPAFQRVLLEAKKLTVYSEVPNELIQDSVVSLNAALGMMFSEGIAFYEDDAFLRGGGAGEPLGILNAPALITVGKETGQGGGTVIWENIIRAYARMLPSSLNRAVWVAHPSTFPQLALMSVNVGTGGSAIWLQSGSGSAPPAILSRPLLFSEKLPALGTVGDIIFADFSYYLIGDRQAMTFSASEHFKFANDQTVFRMVERLDGRPWLQSAITPKSGSDTLSPFVAIATRS